MWFFIFSFSARDFEIAESSPSGNCQDSKLDMLHLFSIFITTNPKSLLSLSNLDMIHTSLLNIHHNTSYYFSIFFFTSYNSPPYSSQRILSLFIILGEDDGGGVCTGCTHFMVFFMVLKNFTEKFFSTQSVIMFCFIGCLFVTSSQCSSFCSFFFARESWKKLSPFYFDCNHS